MGMKGFDEAGAERTCPQWEDLAGFTVDSAVDLLCDFGPRASLSEPVLFFPPLCPRAYTEGAVMQATNWHIVGLHTQAFQQ